MGTWNHRLIEFTEKDGGKWFAVHEVYYGKGGRVQARTDLAVGVCGETIEEARQTLKQLEEAFNAPTLKDTDFGNK